MCALARLHTPDGVLEQPFTPPLPVAALLGPRVDKPCGGRGNCGKCFVRVNGSLSPAEEAERHALPADALLSGFRLACRAAALGDVDIWPEEPSVERIETAFTLPEFPDAPPSPGLGLAVDVGTTTLAACLYDLGSRRLLSVQTMPNPQRAFGADVTTRLQAALGGAGEALQACAAGALRRLAEAALCEVSRDASELHRAVVTGNTAMLYLLTGREPSSIAFAPFAPATRFGCEASGEGLGLPAHTRVWLPECPSAYVGADIACAMLYGDSAGLNPPVLLMDVGTNGEMALFTPGGVLVCSTAAGPAFEGAGIRCGMTARAGAIHRVDAAGEGLTFSVLGGGTAEGLCGSGLVDAVAALRKLEVIDETGRMHGEGHPLSAHMETVEGQQAFRFPGTRVVLTQADVRAVQLAKSAICAGVLTLLKEANLSPKDVTALQIAGGFGSRIRPETAAAIGLIPAALAARAHPLGNAAGAGAAMMLLSDAARARGAALARMVSTVELAASQVFSDYFMEGMLLEPLS